MAKQAKGETITLLVTDDGQDTAAAKQRIHAQHLELHPQDKGKDVNWLELVLVDPPPRSERRSPTQDELYPPEPEPAPAVVPTTPFWVTTALCSEELPGGQIAEGLYDVVDSTVHVSTLEGRFVGKGRAGPDPLAAARTILKGASKGAARWLRAVVPNASIV